MKAFALVLCSVFPFLLIAQNWVDFCPATKLKLEVVEVTGSDVTFDIKLQQLSTSTCGSYGLGNADFLIDFNNAAFTNPTFSKVIGFCDFVAVNPVNNPFVRNAYENINTFTGFVNGPTGNQQMIINLNGPTPTDQPGFDSGVAIIDQTEYTYCRFTLSGFNGTAPLDFAWSMGGSGLTTEVYGIENGDYDNDGFSFLSVQVDLGDTCVIETPVVEPDLSLVLIAVPNNIVGVSSIGVAVSVVEIGGAETDGSSIKVRLPYDVRLSFTWDPTLTNIAFNSVDNASWNYLGDNGIFHSFEYTGGTLAAGEVSSFGIVATYDPQNTSGTTTLTTTIVPLSGGEALFTNNTDVETLVYFD